MIINILLFLIVIIIICFNYDLFSFDKKTLIKKNLIEDLFNGKSGFTKFDGNKEELYFE